MKTRQSAANLVEQSIENYEEKLLQVSDYIWKHPETRFAEYSSMKILTDALEESDFTVETNVGGIETAFVGTFGSGKPVIGLLGEYDALAGMSQAGGITKQQVIDPSGNGHGCGHNLLGTASLAAAFALKDYLTVNNLSGTIKYFGCPGEEGGSGKTFMVRENVFSDVDFALTWHPSYKNSITSQSTLANYQVYFQFSGISSHAAASPHLGRGALDAVELMNKGVNYLREHVIPEARIHYALTDSGGISPNVVQAHAEVLYLIRAPHIEQVDEIYKRIVNIAKGAALMTETEVSVIFDKACSNYVSNRRLEKVLYEKMLEIGPTPYTDEEHKFAEDIWQTLTREQKDNAKGFFRGKSIGDESGRYISDFIFERQEKNAARPVSTDVGDVSWVVPTAQCEVATWAIGTPGHSWQVVSQGTTSFAKKAILQTGKILALTAIEVLEDEQLLKSIEEEHINRLRKTPYINPLPDHVKPKKL